MKNILMSFMFVGLLLAHNQSLSAQEETQIPNKLFFSELGGQGVVMSVNFDSRFNSGTRLGFGYRVGVGFGIGDFEEKLNNSSYEYDGYSSVTRAFYSVPVGLNYVFGRPQTASTFEIGAGATFLTRKVSLYNYEIDKPGHVVGCISFMYRLVPVDGGFSFRVGFTPMIGTAGDIFPMGAVSFGYAF